MIQILNNLALFILKGLLRQSRKLTTLKYNRSLSFGDYVSDRWDKAESLGFGAGTSVYDNVLILGNVSVGANTWIGPNCILDGSGGALVIGDNCSISAGVHIYTHNSVEWSTSGGRAELKTNSTFIGNNCYIGPNSIIAMGTHLNSNCVIGALSFVNGIFVDSNSKLHGIPAKIVETSM